MVDWGTKFSGIWVPKILKILGERLHFFLQFLGEALHFFGGLRPKGQKPPKKVQRLCGEICVSRFRSHVAKGVLNPRRDWIIGVITRWRREKKSRAPYARAERAKKPVTTGRFLAVFSRALRATTLLRVAVFGGFGKKGQNTSAEVYLFWRLSS